MFWNEDENIPPGNDTSPVLDVIYHIDGVTLPVDYQSAIAESLLESVSWWSASNNVGFYLMLAGEEGNGWVRENDPNAVLYLSRRNKLVIRVENKLLETVKSLDGMQLNVKGHKISFKYKLKRTLSSSTTLYARHVVGNEEETVFLQHVQAQLAELKINCKKMLCGKNRALITQNGILQTRSLMLNELNREDSLQLQRQGLGNHQIFGCGIFIPYKNISKAG